MSKATEIVPEDLEREELIAQGQELEIAALKDNAALKVLREALADAEKAMAAMVGRNVLTSNKEVNQRQLDYTRGYYDGARFWLAGRIALAEQRVAIAARAGQADPRPTGREDPRLEGVEDA